jgi:trans-aconitate 2-methyltransferase
MSSQMHQGQIAGTRWDPKQYLKFADHRLRPALELLSRVPLAAPAVIYDLGCGSGQITRMLAERWPSATVYGVDNSPEMLAQAAAESETIQWIEADIQQWQPEAPPDLIFSNATLHWVAAHRDLFPRLLRSLNAGGVLAVQMPLSWGAPSHQLMRETLAGGGSDGHVLGAAELREAMDRNGVEEAETYYDLLAAAATSLDIWSTEYVQVLEGADPVLEWVKGTGLRPILNALDAQERDSFLALYAQRLREAYPMRSDGRTLYPFRRLFIVATV